MSTDRRPRKTGGRALVLLASIATLLFAIVVALPRSGADRAADRGASRVSVPADSEVSPDAAPPAAVLPESSPAPVQPGPLVRPSAEVPYRGKLYIVIDDAGYNLHELEPFLTFPRPITISVLPHLPRSRDAARLAAAAGKGVMLHLPMEAANGADPGPGAIYVDLDDDEIAERVRTAFESVPGAVGANNHMGSLATSDRRVMDVVVSVLGENGGWFLDSRTSPATVARSAAEAAGIPFVERQVFLDNERDHDYIRAALAEGMRLASQRGHAVMIGHVTVHELAEVLMEMYPFILEQGFEFGLVSELIADPVAYERPGN